MNDEYIASVLETAENAALAAGRLVLKKFNKAEIHEKASNNLVTEADILAEAEIRSRILAQFPGHSILGEEAGGEQDMNAEHLWIIDPLDGTNNYAQGIPFFGVSIAYAERGEVLAGCVYAPVFGELFKASKDGGSLLNGRRITVSSRPLENAIIATGFYYDRGDMMRRTLASIQRLFESNIRGIRRMGSAALDFCYVAAGRLDAYFEFQLGPWDFAAGMLIVTEAGGDCRDASGRPLSLSSSDFAITNGTFTDQFIEIINPERNEDL